MVEECRATIERFLLPLLSRGNLRVILTGAGTSAFAGRARPPISVPASTAASRRSPPPTSSPIRRIPGTGLPTLLISARSGNSPESVAVVAGQPAAERVPPPGADLQR
jgi:tagatose-6-phosphate ketose/aldose isomerase